MKKFQFPTSPPTQPKALHVLVFTIVSWKRLRAAAGLLLESLVSFFVPQTANVIFKRRQVIFVDHVLDADIAFDPRHVNKYMEFIPFLVNTYYQLGKLSRVTGIASQDDCRQFLCEMRRLYKDAGSIYKQVHTTTVRPREHINARFFLIHAFDPHLNCIPSLHVLLVVASWFLARRSLEKAMANKDFVADASHADTLHAWIESLWREVILITDAILYIKQHSINCVIASLYYLRQSLPGFEDRDAQAIVAGLFENDAGNVPNKQQIRTTILDGYNKMCAQHAALPDPSWQKIILDFIRECARETKVEAANPHSVRT